MTYDIDWGEKCEIWAFYAINISCIFSKKIQKKLQYVVVCNLQIINQWAKKSSKNNNSPQKYPKNVPNIIHFDFGYEEKGKIKEKTPLIEKLNRLQKKKNTKR